MRSDVARALCVQEVKSENAKEFAGLIAAAKSSTIERMAKDFLACSRGLIDIPEETTLPPLLKIMQQAVDMSTKLSTQRSDLEVLWGEHLPAKFSAGLRSTEAHSVHNIDLDDDDTALDGKQVLMVTFPLIVAMGKSNGTDYTMQRVLKKAVVWMGKP